MIDIEERKRRCEEVLVRNGEGVVEGKFNEGKILYGGGLIHLLQKNGCFGKNLNKKVIGMLLLI